MEERELCNRMARNDGVGEEEEAIDTAAHTGSAGWCYPSGQGGLGKASCPPGQAQGNSGPWKWHRAQQEAGVP